MAGYANPCPPRLCPPGQPFPYTWAHNPSAWVGIILCLVLLYVWVTRNSIYLKRRKDWRDGD